MQKLSTDQAIKLAVATIVTLALMSGMTSCTSSKIVYEKGSSWKPLSKKSEMTGVVYNRK